MDFGTSSTWRNFWKGLYKASMWRDSMHVMTTDVFELYGKFYKCWLQTWLMMIACHQVIFNRDSFYSWWSVPKLVFQCFQQNLSILLLVILLLSFLPPFWVLEPFPESQVFTYDLSRIIWPSLVPWMKTLGLIVWRFIYLFFLLSKVPYSQETSPGQKFKTFPILLLQSPTVASIQHHWEYHACVTLMLLGIVKFN